MLYVIETSWVWFVVAVIAGVAVGYGTTSAKEPLLHGFGWLRWLFIAFVVGVIVAIFGALPDRAGFYLETLLGVVFSYVVGSLAGGLLRKAWSHVEAAPPPSAVRASDAPVPTIDETPSVGTAAAAVHAEVESIKVTEEARRAADARAAEEARQAADAKAAEEVRRAADAKAAEAARQAADAKAAEEESQAGDGKPAEAARRAATTKVAGETRRPADSKAAAQTRRATSGKNGRRVAEAKAAEETRRAVHAKAAEEVRRAADAEAAAEARRSADERARQAVHAKAVEDVRRAADTEARRGGEEARRAAAEAARQAVHAQAAKEVYRAADAEAAAEARRAADAKAAMGRRLAETTTNTKLAEAPRPAARSPEPIRPDGANAAQVPQLASVGPSRPAGFDSPLNDKADDLKLIKGIGAKNEKICNDLGIFHFAQIADWSSDEAAWVGHHMAFPGRVEREHWIPQAKLLASGGDTEHSTGVKAGTIVLDARADAPLDEAQTATLRESLPAQAEAVENETRHAGRRPYGLRAPRGTGRDNLKRIRGIGPQNESRLNGTGIWHYGQIAAWSIENIKWISSYLAVSGRIEREKWVDQAKELAAGRDTEFSRRTAARKNAAAKTDPAPGRSNPHVGEPYKEG
jgi:predicted flap endonuclease-1-like 5' DNA nuclease/uncharacterized membrane protein YeaQ/YmgE (transglycosylase-associated protein family)